MRQLNVPKKVVIGVANAAIVFTLALVGGQSLARAAILAGILLAFAIVLLFGGRSETVHLMRAEGHDERQRQIHLNAMALVAQVLVIAIVAGFFVEMARGTLEEGSPFIWLGGLGGVTYMFGLFFLRRRI